VTNPAEGPRWEMPPDLADAWRRDGTMAALWTRASAAQVEASLLRASSEWSRARSRQVRRRSLLRRSSQ